MVRDADIPVNNKTHIKYTENRIPENRVQIDLKKIITYQVNEIVSYQIVWKNFVKWVPAKIIRKISNSVYIITVNGVSRSAHLRQLRKSQSHTLENWPGSFQSKVNDNIIENSYIVRNNPEIPNYNTDFSDLADNTVNENEKGNLNVHNSRKRRRVQYDDEELRRSERLKKVARRTYSSFF